MWLCKHKYGPLAALLTAAFLLNACGWRLQGVGGYPESMNSTYVDAKDRYTPFYRKLRVALEQGGVKLAASPIDADTVIRIEKDDAGQRVLTVSGRNVPTEYNAFYSVTYSVWSDGKQVRKPHSLSSRQDYNYDSTQILGKARESEKLQSALADRLVAQVSRELSSID
jgi:outer membrane lipopolysaccharide assembly protein LptE/RlpB